MRVKMEQSELSRLLALRDGEPVAAAGKGENDEANLEHLRQIKAGLNDLPDVPVPEALWKRSGPSRAHTIPGSGTWRYPLATAASVFLVSTFAVVMLLGGWEDLPETPLTNNSMPSGLVRLDPQVVALMSRSEDLERVVSNTGGWRGASDNRLDRQLDGRGDSPAGVGQVDGRAGSGDAPDPSLQISEMGELILYKLAQTDAQIDQLQETQSVPGELWQQRVNLLQAFIAEMARTNPGRFEDSHNM